jgi:hypothetical protein
VRWLGSYRDVTSESAMSASGEIRPSGDVPLLALDATPGEGLNRKLLTNHAHGRPDGQE